MSTLLERYSLILAISGLTLLSSGGFTARACPICLPAAKTSAVDVLLDADVVVLAEEDSQNPLSLRTLEVLAGQLNEDTPDLFLGSQPARGFALSSRQQIICAYRAAGPEAGWVRVGNAEGEFGVVVREVLQRTEEWKVDPGKRVDFFGPYLGHPDTQVSALAHLEVARAPYDQIKRFAGVIPAERLRSLLQNVRLFEWHPLYILLLAQSGETQDRDLIREEVRAAERDGTVLQLAAWVTAWIEIDGETAVDFLEEHYLQDPTRKAEEIQAVLAACSVHGTWGHARLRGRFVTAYRSALRVHPSLAVSMVRDLVEWKRWDLGPAVATVVDTPPAELDRTTVLQLRSYLRQAGEQAQIDYSPTPEVGWANVTIAVGLVLLVVVPVGLALASRSGRRRKLEETAGP